MTSAVLAKAETDPAFAATVKAAARRVVELKRKYIAFDYPDGSADPRRANMNSSHPFL